MRVAIDLDGVIFDHAGPFVELYNLWHGTDIGPLQKWDDTVALTRFETQPEAWAWADRAGLWDRLPYIPGAPGALDHLTTTRQCLFLTSRSNGGAEAAVEWHKRSPWSDIELRTHAGTKAHVPCSIFIDDSPEVIKAVVAAGKVGIVFDQPWNARFKFEHRAKNWDEVIEIVEGL